MEDSVARTIEVDGAPVLGVDTGLGREQFARSGRGRLAAGPGRLVTAAGTYSQWKLEGNTEIDGRVFVYGTAFSGVPFLNLAQTDADAALAALAVAGRCAAEDSEAPPPLPASLFVGSDGSLLILPEKEVIRALDVSGNLVDGASRWMHSGLGRSETTLFTLAALAYRLLSGSAPFDAAGAEAVALDIRDGRAMPLRFASPGVDPEFARLVDDALGIAGGEKRPRPTLADFSTALTHANGVSTLRKEISEAERKLIEAEGERYRARLEAITGRKRFFRKNSTKIIAVSASVAIIALAVWSVVAGKSPQFDTVGLSPRDVAMTFYSAYSELETEKMQACVTSGAAKNDIDAAINMFVISRVRSAYERDGGFLSASKWVASGSPETTKTIFGLVDLRIEETGRPDELIVLYSFFAPGQGVEEREDHVSLLQKDKRWKIKNVERKVRSKN
ncbi:MAG: hypothetical protein WCT14_08260 [Treponemataceae bacterium]